MILVATILIILALALVARREHGVAPAAGGAWDQLAAWAGL